MNCQGIVRAEVIKEIELFKRSIAHISLKAVSKVLGNSRGLNG